MVPQKKAIVTAAPLIAAAPTSASTTTGAPASADEAARKKAFEAAVQQKLQEEMMKLQQDYTKSLQKSQSKNAPVQVATTTAAPAPQRATEDAPSAAALDQQRLAARPEPQPAQQAPVLQPQQQPQQAPAVAEQQQAPVRVIHEGDVVDVSDLDTPPHTIRGVQPAYPPMAVRQRAEATILVTALINENGDVLDVKVLRGDKRFGFEEAALRAVRATKFSPPIKDGKRVKSWFAMPVIFKL
jgi:protein TonB